MEKESKGLSCQFGGGFYKLLDTIGEGTFGKVYRGINETTREYVAVKVVSYIIILRSIGEEKGDYYCMKLKYIAK